MRSCWIPMRPEHLLIRGFASFRRMPEAIDFTDADLFALTGPTGAGKSSIIDAMCFALYGRIPRLPGNAVEPVITLGATEARIDFSFSIGDTSYRVARVVERRARGAVQREAILEGTDEPVSGADQVTKAVVELTGLTFEHFTRCVVLPQGEFAAFLHDRPANRQDLLRSLLDLEMYERVRLGAQELKARNEATAEVLEKQLEEAGSIDVDAELELRGRIEQLRAMETKVALAVDAWKETEGEATGIEGERKRIDALVTALSKIAPPAGVADIAERAAAARRELAEAHQSAEEATTRLLEVENASEDLPSLDEIDAGIARHARRNELDTRIARGAEVVRDSEARHEAAGSELSAAQRDLEAARTDQTAVERDHLAHALRPALAIGEPCPVCTAVVEVLPSEASPHDLAAVVARVAEAESRLAAATSAFTDVTGGLEAGRKLLEGLKEELASLGDMSGPAEEELRATRSRVVEHHELVKRLREADRAARTAHERVRVALDAVQREEQTARESLSAALVGIAIDEPPEFGAELPVDRAWDAMVRWRDGALVDRKLELEALDTARSEIDRRRAGITAEMKEMMPEAGVADPIALGPVIAGSIARAEANLERFVELKDRVGLWTSDLAAARQKAAVASVLARELAAAGFEGWILEEALSGLVDGANAVLASMLGGSYSLQVEKRDFVIVDHANADERRPVRTLSGGETFLVSLALALALAERLAMLSPAGTARLESILLDEGFGTLDGETMETVAGVLHELSASGERVVGIVTHVKELAELMPVRFVVERGPDGATVHRVDS